jgi:ABC-type lipoprotein export system ATPase subunit
LVRIYKIAELEVVALRGLNLEVAAGEMMAIVGNSGSGKSTLLNILGGLDRPSAGACSVGGLDLVNASGAELAEYKRYDVGFVWQQSARNLIPYLSALDNVLAPMLFAGGAGPTERRRARELVAHGTAALDTAGLAAPRLRQLARFVIQRKR